MSDPRIPEAAVRSAVDGLEEIEFLDRGAQGDAWRIRRNGDGNEVLKVIVQGDSARVAKEIGAMKAVKSPFVMGFTEAGSLEHAGTGYPYIVGEYVPGKSVGSRVVDGEWPSKEEALAVGVGMLRGLAAIHEVEKVHRDIKPGNLAIRDDDWSKPVILDLGLVRDMLGDTLTAYPDLMGTVLYMSPEQLRKEKAVKRSDVFGAGVTLYLLLTEGKHPFLVVGETVAIEVLEERIRDEDWPKWEEADGMSDEVREVLELLLRPDAYRRPRADAAAEALESVMEAAA
jgi:serine/threonine protein kinase